MFLYNNESPLTFRDAQPREVDVVVIGGGIIGVSTAWYLLKQGFSVFIADKGRIAGEQSSRNWGWVRVTWRDEAEVPIAIDSLNCWQALSKELADDFGEDLGFTRGGIMGLAHSEKEMHEFEQWMPIAKAHDMDTHLLSRTELKNHLRMETKSWHGGILTPSDARAEPFKAVPAIAKGVQARGGLIRESCAVRTLDWEGGQVAGVITEEGPVRSKAVLCAAGAWSNMFLSNMGISFPQLALRGTVARTAVAPEIFGGAAALHDVFVRRRQDGGFTVATGMAEHSIGVNSFRYFKEFMASTHCASDLRFSLDNDVTQPSIMKKRWNGEEQTPFESNRVLNPAPTRRALKKMRDTLGKRVPELASVEFVESWAGMIDATPDLVPVMDEIPDHKGLFLASGFSGHGFGFGPGAGRLMADQIAGNSARYDLSRFRFSRFSDGSQIVPGPGL